VMEWSMRTAYYKFEDLGNMDSDGWEAGSFTGRVEVVHLARTDPFEKSPDEWAAFQNRLKFALGKVEIEYATLDVDRKWLGRLRVAPEYVQKELRPTLYTKHHDEIRETLDIWDEEGDNGAIANAVSRLTHRWQRAN
jgi:hypothetical protein